MQIIHIYFNYKILILCYIWYVFRESKVLKRTIQCCALNGGVFWASILIFECGLLPFLKYLLTIIFGHSPGMGMTVWSWMKPFLSLTFGTVWVLPLFVLSRIVNSLWFQVWIIWSQNEKLWPVTTEG